MPSNLAITKTSPGWLVASANVWSGARISDSWNQTYLVEFDEEGIENSSKREYLNSIRAKKTLETTSPVLYRKVCTVCFVCRWLSTVVFMVNPTCYVEPGTLPGGDPEIRRSSIENNHELLPRCAQLNFPIVLSLNISQIKAKNRTGSSTT